MRKDATYSDSEMALFYKHQLRKFEGIGVGNKTEWGVVVTDELIAVTQKRLEQLSVSALRRRIRGI